MKNRWPSANVIGIDTSKNMLVSAAKQYPKISFIHGDIQQLSLEKKADILFANASLQWLDNYDLLIQRLVNQLNSNGILAIQMPNNFHFPSHQMIIKTLSDNIDWQALLKHLRYQKCDTPFYNPENYYHLLSQSGLKQISIWETTYQQVVSDHFAIYQWLQGTGLRPILDNMNPNEQIEFKKNYIQNVSSVYSKQSDNNLLFPFRRIFMLGSK